MEGQKVVRTHLHLKMHNKLVLALNELRRTLNLRWPREKINLVIILHYCLRVTNAETLEPFGERLGEL